MKVIYEYVLSLHVYLDLTAITLIIHRPVVRSTFFSCNHQKYTNYHKKAPNNYFYSKKKESN